jgi:hypothetical protein
MELKHGTLVQKDSVVGKTRWSKFKDFVVTHPETSAYAGTFVASTAVVVKNFESQSTGAVGVGMFSLMATMGAFVREDLMKKSFTKADRIVTSAIADVGFVAAAAMMLYSNHPVAGATVGSVTMLASLVYKPVKEIITNTAASVKQKIGMLTCGTVGLTGMFAAVTGMSSGGVDGLLKLNLHTWQHIVADLGAAVVGITVAILAGKQFGKIADGIKNETGKDIF